jgi:hypothetical protein
MKYWLFSLVLMVGHLANAQSYRPFKINVSSQYIFPTASEAVGGASFSIEPRYSLNRSLDLGIRVELASIGYRFDVDGIQLTIRKKSLTSQLLTGTYFLRLTGIRPYIGVGVGLYQLPEGNLYDAATRTTPSYTYVKGGSKAGLMVRTGLKINHLNVGAEYNLIGQSITVLPTTEVNYRNSYLGIKLGVDIGGGAF